ncbi:MAG: hypothetical protein KDI10_05690 [Halioglobus sp.]|nr:hypothetical protein [Halioglobus sp.]MCP5122046.1 hypothetical protein [Pseudomonadales bacterium]MCP5192408.1 hypothetical protein [Pseudomonadales bacterium]
MAGPFTLITSLLGTLCHSLVRGTWLACTLLMLMVPPAHSQTPAPNPEIELQALTQERGMLTAELDQYKATVRLIQTDGRPPEQSGNPAVRRLALEMVKIKERLIVVTERELTLLQEQITAARALAAASPQYEVADGIESKPLRVTTPDYSMADEQEHVERLRTLLASYYAELQEAARTLPSEEELAARAAAQLEAEQLARIPFSADKVQLSGAEGSTALSQITRRLTDPDIPESRRDIAPICGIRTELFGALIASEQRSLRPVGKNNYVARIRLQPGDTTLRIKDKRWAIQVPQNDNAGDFLVTLYVPPDSPPELHLFAVDDLLAEDNPHIPAWLPQDINLKSRAG